MHFLHFMYRDEKIQVQTSNVQIIQNMALTSHIVTYCKLRWICRKYSNNVTKQDETQVRSKFFASLQKYSILQLQFLIALEVTFTESVLYLHAAIDGFLV